MPAHPAYLPSMDSSAPGPSLARVVTAARAGSIDHAAALFRAGGFDRRSDDPAALAVAGRIAKDRALRLPLAERSRALAAAATHYAQSFALDPQPYTRINQATLTLLAGEVEAGQAMARSLLDWLDSGASFAETPYFLAATRAEALLLLGRRDAAEAALAAAIGPGSDSAEDQATTLRQLRLILDAQGADAGWLDAYRPRQALNYAGHLGIAEVAVEPLAKRVHEVLDEWRIGAGFGALAAGADLVVAEALLEAGAQLNVVLPTAPAEFLAQSVSPYGSHWAHRFERAMAEAASLRWVSTVAGAYEPLAAHLAADVAMGASVLHARRLETGAVQLLVIDEAGGRFGGGKDTAYLGERWGSARPQVTLIAARSAPVIASGAKPAEGRPDRCLTAMLHIAFDGVDTLEDSAFAAALDTMILPFRADCEAIAEQPDVVLPCGNARIVAFTDPDRAWHYARALLALPQAKGRLRLTGHYGLAHWLGTPRALVGTSIAALEALAPVALPGVLTASGALASALFVNQSAAIHAEEIGTWRGDALFALTADPETGPCQ